MSQMIRRYLRPFFLVMFALIYTSILHAQQSRISGTVKDSATNRPVSGVSVVNNAARSSGTSTSETGEFTIVGKPGDRLTLTSVGYESVTVTVGNETQIEVTLLAKAGQLNEVVVVGYGSTTKKDVTGSVKSIKSEDFNRGIINSPEQLLQGKVSGVNVTSASGEPGGAQNITVRGPGGVRTGSTPLFVVDGFPLDNSGTGGATNPLTFLNPQDIQSIDVLKDASATAIYGSRGANGVIIITTKKGRAGFSTVNYGFSMGVATMARALPLFSADEFKKQVVGLGGVLDDQGANTDWQKEITRSAITQTHNLSLSGGANKFTYYASLNMQKQEGIIKGNRFDTYSGRINLSQKLLDDKLTIEVNLNATNTYNERPPSQGMIGSALAANPTYPAYAPDGTAARYQGVTNPLITLALDKEYTTKDRVLGNIAGSLTLAKGLVYRLNFGIDNSTSTSDNQSLPNALPAQIGGLTTINNNNRNNLVENYLTYSRRMNDHNISALAGHSYQKIFVQSRATSITGFPILDIEPRYNPGLGQQLTLANNRPTGYAFINELQSFFSRINYQYQDKYLLTATFRADGSSKFGENNKYGYFPSFSAGWIVSEEKFMESSIFNSLKLRAGWGQTGNQEIPPKITQELYTSVATGSSSYPLFPIGTYPGGTTVTRLANEDIQWEVSTQTDVGLDFSLLKGRLTGTVDYFRKVSNNILLQIVPADPVQPASTTWSNIKDMTVTNKGLELELNYQHTAKGGFGYNVGGNVTFINNVVAGSPYSILSTGSASGSGITSATINGYINGQPIGTFFLKEFIGFDSVGKTRFTDVNKSGGPANDNDRVALGTALPTFMYNFNGDVSYKNFYFSANFNGVSGNKIFDNTSNAFFSKTRLAKGINTTAEAVQFREESTSNTTDVSSRYLKSGAYLRLNNASIGYTFKPEALGLSRWVSNLRLSLTGQNLFVITDYDGYDPEVNTDRSDGGISSYGIDYLSYPKARSFILSLNVALK
ncbi:MAG: SusC/RagA family TonB-linked outer membrane protein [Segetibacter sp.]|nr:SusC/RagA family TonB-linked outer membrane protein [Segetibacter sp.]